MEQKRLHLLVLEDSPNQAEALVSLFRNAGHAARVHRLTSSEDLVEALKQEWDLLIAAPQSATLAPKDVLSMVRLQNLDIPFIQLLEPPVTSEAIEEALVQGARAAVEKDATDLLLLISQRELENLNNRRKLAALETALKEAQKRNQLLLETSMDAVAYIHEGMHIYTNRAYLELFGYKSFDDMEGMPIVDLLHSKDMNNLKDLFKKRVETQATCEGESADGKTFPVNIELSPATYDSEECIQLVVRKKVDANNAELEERLREVSNQDISTGLYNKNYMLQLLPKVLAQAKESKKSTTTALVQIDHYGRMLREVGIAGGDLVLKEIGGLMRKTFNKGDKLSRIQDSAFLLVFPDKPQDSIVPALKGLLETVRNHIFDVNSRTVQITLSIGVAEFDGVSSSVQQVMDRIQHAMEKLKEGNGIVVYDPAEELAAAASRGDIAALLQQTLLNNGLSLVYQPIVNLRGDSSELYEVRLRMLDKDRNELPLIQLLSVAEETGLSKKIDRWILVNALKAVAAQKEKGHDTGLFVQISEPSLQDESLLPWLESQLKAINLPADRIILQLSESDAAKYMNQAQTLTEGFRAIGGLSALSEFGASPNSQSMLSHLPVNFIKIDSAFTAKSGKKDNNEALTEVLTSVRESNKLSIVPFVENASVLATLWQAGADYVQGYYLQKPVPTMSYDFSAE